MVFETTVNYFETEHVLSGKLIKPKDSIELWFNLNVDINRFKRIHADFNEKDNIDSVKFSVLYNIVGTPQAFLNANQDLNDVVEKSRKYKIILPINKIDSIDLPIDSDNHYKPAIFNEDFYEDKYDW